MNSINFNIDSWTAISPGLITQDDWVKWSNLNCEWPSILQDVSADLIKPMMRRRMSNLSKIVLQAALKISINKEIDYIVFSSRHGELDRTVKLIKEIIKGEDASPMAFSQSVHNTASGLFTISSKRDVPATSLSAVESSLHHALIEAAIYLDEKPLDKVLLVDFDEPLPIEYKKYENSGKPYQGYAFSAILSAGKQFELSWSKNDNEKILTFPQTLMVINNIIQNKKEFSLNDQRVSWCWNVN